MESNVYYKMSEADRVILNEVSEVTMTDYGMEQYFIPIENLFVALKDLLCEYHHKEEELKDLKNDIRENYEPKKFDPYEEYGVSKKDFY